MSKRRSEDNGDDVPAKRSSTGKLDSVVLPAAVTESEKVLKELSALFPVEIFNHQVPPVVMKHMLYSQISDRTRVDREIDQLRCKGVVRVFKLGEEQESHALLLKDCYANLIRKKCSDSPVVRKFTSTVLENVKDICVDKQTLTKLGLTEADIKELVQECLLNIRSATSFWFSFPGAGKFMKPYIQGRNAILSTIKKCKYKQILRPELESRKMKKTVLLGLKYHIHDIIGSDKVSVMDTTCGQMLKFV